MYRWSIITISILFIASCAYESEEDLFDDQGCMDENVSYQTQVEPILKISCYGCHGKGINSGGVTLEGHTNTLIFVKNGSLLGAIKHLAGFSKMPQNSAMLPECQIQQIESWINDGALNN